MIIDGLKEIFCKVGETRKLSSPSFSMNYAWLDRAYNTAHGMALSGIFDHFFRDKKIHAQRPSAIIEKCTTFRKFNYTLLALDFEDLKYNFS